MGNQNDVFFRVVPPQVSEVDRRLKTMSESLKYLRTQLTGLEKSKPVDDSLGRPQDIALVEKQITSISAEIEAMQAILSSLPDGFHEAGKKAAETMAGIGSSARKAKTEMEDMPERIVPSESAMPTRRSRRGTSTGEANEELHSFPVGDSIWKSLQQSASSSDAQALAVIKLLETSKDKFQDDTKIQQALEELTSVSDGSGATLRKMLDEQKKEIQGRVAILEQVYDLIPQSATEATYDALSGMATSLERQIDDMKENASNLEARVMQDTPENFSEFQKALEGAATAQERLQKQADYYKKKIKETVDLLVAQERMLKDLVDPSQIANTKAGIDQTREALTRFQKEQTKFMEESQRLPGIDAIFNSNDVDMRAAIDYTKQMTLGKEELLLREQQIREEIVEQRELLRESRKALEEANDPRIIEGMTDAQQALGKKIEDNVELLQRMEDARRYGGDGSADLAGYSETIGRLGSFVERRTERSSSLQNSGIGNQLAGAIESISDLTEKADEWKGQLKDLRGQLLETQVRIGKWSEELSKKFPKLGKFAEKLGKASGTAAGGVGNLEVMMGRITAVIAGLTLGFQVFDAITGKSTEAIEGRIERLRDEIDATERVLDLQSVEAMDERAEAIREEIAMREEEAVRLRAASAQNTSTFDQIRTILGSFAGDRTVYGQTGDALDEVSSEINELNDELNLLADSGLREAVEAAQEAREATQRLEQAQRDMYQLLTEASDSSEKYQQDIDDINENYEKDRFETMIERREADTEALRGHLEELSDSEKDYQKEIEDLRIEHLKTLQDEEMSYYEERDKKFKDFEKQWVKAALDLEEELLDDQKDYQEEREKKVEDHQKSVLKSDEEFTKQRLEHLEDMQETLLDAEMDNDVLAFIQAKRQSERQLKKMDEDHAEQKEEDEKNFLEELEEDRQNHILSMQEKRQQHAEQREEDRVRLTEEIAESDAAHQERMAQLKEEFAERLKVEADAHTRSLHELTAAFEEQEQARAEQRLREDMADQRQREADRQQATEQYEEELTQAQEQQDRLLAIIESGGTLIEEAEDWTTQQRIESLTSAHQEFMDRMGFIITDKGLITQQELQEQRQRASDLAILTGSETLDQLSSYAEEQTRDIENAYAELSARDEATRTQFIANWQNYFYGENDDIARQYANLSVMATDHWEEVLSDTTAHYDLTESAYISHLEQEESATSSHYETLNNARLNTYAQEEIATLDHERWLTDTQERGQTDRLEAETAHQASLTTTLQAGMSERDAMLTDMQTWFTTMRSNHSQYYQYIEEQFLLHSEILYGYYQTGYRDLESAYQEYRDGNTLVWEENFAILSDLQSIQHQSQYELEAMSYEERAVASRAFYSTQMTDSQQFQTQLVSLYESANGAIISGVSQMVNSVRSMLSSMGSIGGSKTGTGYKGGTTVKNAKGQMKTLVNQIRGKAFAEGGVIDRPTLALMGEEETELVVPFDKSKGLPGQLFGSRVQLSFGNITIGSDISRIEVIKQIQQLGDAVLDVIENARRSS